MGAGITIGQVPGKILSLRSALKASNINKVKDRPALLPSAGFNVFFGVTLANSYVRLALNPGGLIIGALGALCHSGQLLKCLPADGATRSSAVEGGIKRSSNRLYSA